MAENTNPTAPALPPDMKPEPRKSMVYIGRKDCGCVVAATVDDGVHLEELGNDVRDMIVHGYTVERVASPVSLKRCQCGELPLTAGEPTPHGTPS